VGMPGEDGYSLIERLRSMGDWRSEMPCVAVTALSRPEDRERAMQAGYDEHVGKPFDPAGLCFTIARLLRGRTKAKDDLEPSTEGLGSMMGVQPGKISVQPHVLVAEDNQNVAELLKTCLEDRGYRVSLADSLKDGIALAEAEPVDLVLSDLRLKDGMGWDLLTGMATRVPAIVMSGYMDDEHVRRSKAAGFAEYLVKPVDTDELLNVVHDLLNRSRESKEGGSRKVREDEGG
jgi:DNA-binding response OmpR family regulator